MKKVLSLAVVFAMALGFVVPVFAATTSTAPIAASATIPSALSLSVVMKKNDFAGATITTMAYGNLVNIGTNTLRSSPTSTTGTGAVAAFITANTQGLPYDLTQDGTAMSNGVVSLPTGALIVKAIYNAADNASAAQPVGSTTPSSGGVSWVGTRTLFHDPTGSLRTVTAFYSVTDDPAAGATAGVPLNQAAGTYNGTVTFTVTTF